MPLYTLPMNEHSCVPAEVYRCWNIKKHQILYVTRYYTWFFSNHLKNVKEKRKKENYLSLRVTSWSVPAALHVNLIFAQRRLSCWLQHCMTHTCWLCEHCALLPIERGGNRGTEIFRSFSRDEGSACAVENPVVPRAPRFHSSNAVFLTTGLWTDTRNICLKKSDFKIAL